MEAIDYTALAAAQIRDPLLPLWLMETLASLFLYVWLFAFGATVGSFSNVVVYRLPRGKNLAYPGSACPHCGHPIRLTDNIPILSWLALGGRCRDCGGAISPRYFWVELFVATTFLVVLVGERFLPALSLSFATRRLLTPHDGAPFWGMYAMHLILMTTLIAAPLIMADDFRVPAVLYVPALVVGLALPLYWPEVRSVPAFSYGNLPGWQQGLIDGLAGIVVMSAVIAAMIALARADRGRRPGLGAIALACSVGVVMGWQRAIWLLPLIGGAGLLIAGTLRTMPAASSEATSEPRNFLDSFPPDPAADLIETPSPAVIEEEAHIVSPPSETNEPS